MTKIRKSPASVFIMGGEERRGGGGEGGGWAGEGRRGGRAHTSFDHRSEIQKMFFFLTTDTT